MKGGIEKETKAYEGKGNVLSPNSLFSLGRADRGLSLLELSIK